jgi:YVTN family beta-propeller protein
VGSLPWAVAVNPVTNRVYVANEHDHSVSVIDGASNAVIASPAIGTGPYAMAVNLVTNKVYVANSKGDSMSVIDGASNLVIATPPVGTYPVGVAVNPVTNRVYVANYYANSLSVIDGESNTVVATLSVGTGPCAVAVNPVTNNIYAVNRRDNTVSVIDGASNIVVATPSVGESPYRVAVNPVTNRIYVANIYDSSVSVIDGASNAVVATPAVGGEPQALAVNPVTNKVYVANYNHNSLSVIQEVPVYDTKVLAALPRLRSDSLNGDTTSLARPVFSGKGVGRSTPNRTRMMTVGNRWMTAQQAWDTAHITYTSPGGDSIQWTYVWGSDSLILGENFVCCVPLEDQAAITNNLGLGTPFAGNTEVYPVYRVGSAGGVEENVDPQATSLRLEPTIIRGVLFLPRDGLGTRSGLSDNPVMSRAILLDVSGRRVMDLKPGANDVRALAPGVYFVREAQAQAHAVRKVVITR